MKMKAFVIAMLLFVAKSQAILNTTDLTYMIMKTALENELMNLRETVEKVMKRSNVKNDYASSKNNDLSFTYGNFSNGVFDFDSLGKSPIDRLTEEFRRIEDIKYSDYALSSDEHTHNPPEKIKKTGDSIENEKNKEYKKYFNIITPTLVATTPGIKHAIKTEKREDILFNDLTNINNNYANLNTDYDNVITHSSIEDELTINNFHPHANTPHTFTILTETNEYRSNNKNDDINIPTKRTPSTKSITKAEKNNQNVNKRYKSLSEYDEFIDLSSVDELRDLNFPRSEDIPESKKDNINNNYEDESNDRSVNQNSATTALASENVRTTESNKHRPVYDKYIQYPIRTDTNTIDQNMAVNIATRQEDLNQSQMEKERLLDEEENTRYASINKQVSKSKAKYAYSKINNQFTTPEVKYKSNNKQFATRSPPTTRPVKLLLPKKFVQESEETYTMREDPNIEIVESLSIPKNELKIVAPHIQASEEMYTVSSEDYNNEIVESLAIPKQDLKKFTKIRPPYSTAPPKQFAEYVFLGEPDAEEGDATEHSISLVEPQSYEDKTKYDLVNQARFEDDIIEAASNENLYTPEPRALYSPTEPTTNKKVYLLEVAEHEGYTSEAYPSKGKGRRVYLMEPDENTVHITDPEIDDAETTEIIKQRRLEAATDKKGSSKYIKYSKYRKPKKIKNMKGDKKYLNEPVSTQTYESPKKTETSDSSELSENSDSKKNEENGSVISSIKSIVHSAVSYVNDGLEQFFRM